MTLDAADLVANATRLDTVANGRPATGTADWDTTSATTQTGEQKGKTVWHKIFCPGAGTCVFDQLGGVAGDTYMYVYRGPSNGIVSVVADLGAAIAADDDSAGSSKARCTVGCNANDWLFIASSMLGGGASGAQKLNWSIPLVFNFGVTDFVRSLLDSSAGIAQPGKVARVNVSTLRTPAYLASHAVGPTRPTSGVLIPRPGVSQ